MNATQLSLPGMSTQASPIRRPAVDHAKVNKREVFEQTKPKHSGHRAKIAELLQRLGSAGATRDEIAERLQMPLTTVCGRVNELKKMGDVSEPGERRLTRNGKTAVVVCWRIRESA